MRISDVKINGFGVWTGLQVERLANDVTVFYGPNEAGKTTLMQFMRTVLYGFTPERRGRYLPPLNGGQPGGLLRVNSLRGEFEIQRRASVHDALDNLGDVVVTDAQGGAQSPYQLNALLAGIDESIFDNVFAIGLREMQEVSTLNDSAAAELLYKLTSGLDRVSLIDVMRELSSSRTRILGPDERKSELTQLLAKRELLQREIDELQSRGRRWPQLAAQRLAFGHDLEQIEHEITDVQKQIYSYDLVLQVRDKWWARRQLDEQLTSLGPALEVPRDAVEQLDVMNGRIKKLKRRLLWCKRQRKTFREEMARHVVQDSLLSQGPRIQALSEHGPWIGSLEAEVTRLKDEVAALEREAESRRPSIDVPSGTPKSKLPDLSAKTLSLLRTPAARLNHLTKIAERVQREAEAVKVRTDSNIERINAELSEIDAPSISVALENAGTRVAQLRRRIELEERIEQLQWQRKELEGQSAEMFDTQLMPFERMAWQLGGFMLSALLIFTGLFGPAFWTLQFGWSILSVIAGVLSLGVSIISKLEWERESHRSLESADRQVELLDHQLKEAKEERDELDRQLPSGGGPLDSRLQQAEKHLQHLEQLAPMASQRHEVAQHVDVAERRAAKMSDELKEARKAWSNALRSANLPESLSPNEVRHLARAFKQVLIVRKQLHQKREELESRVRELGTLSSRIAEVLGDAGLRSDVESPQGQLKFLTAALADQQQVVQRRAVVKQQYRKLHERWKKATGAWESVNRARRALLHRANAETENDLRHLVQRQHQALALQMQRDDMTQQIRLVVGEKWTEELLARELLHHDGETPENRREKLSDKLAQTKARLSSVHEKRGLLAAEMKTLAEDRRMGEARLELGCIEEQVVQAVRRWQVLAVTGLVLESVRGTYESTRQPETLREASTYLQRLTQGQYVRIWTPIQERMLQVDDQKGQTLSLDKLSRGTREAVFLSLRLALAAGYARRGATLPMILDDVLVNFDSRRVKAAAALLREFAQHGHQLLMFTCHEHIMQIFRNERADVRLIPNRHGEPMLEPAPIAEPEAREPEPVEPPPPPKPKKKRPEPVVETPEPVVALPPPPPVVAPTPVLAIAQAIPIVEERVEKPVIVERPFVIVESRPAPPPPTPIVLAQSRATQTIVVAPKPEVRDEKVVSPPRAKKVGSTKPTLDRRFTWESPERYVEEELVK